MGLSNEQIQALLYSKPPQKKPPPKSTVQRVSTLAPQDGPLRWFDKEMRCASKGCGSSTFCKVEGTPRCMMHSLRIMNEMLIDLDKDTLL